MKQEEIDDAIQRQEEIILDRKTRLAKTDYIAAKIAEGAATREEYQEKLAERQQWREDINAANERLAELGAETPDEEGRAEAAN